MTGYAVLNGQYTDETLYDLEFIKGSECYLIDKNNKRYLDLRSGLWNVSLGYTKKINNLLKIRLDSVLEDGIGYLDIHSYKHDSYDRVSNKLLDILGNNFEKIIFTNSGSENTELALKISRYINTKSKNSNVLAFNNSYHGTFFGGMSVSGIDTKINSIFTSKMTNVKLIDFPNNISEEKSILEYIDKISPNYDAMFIEPVLASAGIYYTSSNFFNKLFRILKKNQVLIVLDEVATGFFKTGQPFYFNHLSELPDIICLSKGINNGILPFGCIAVSEEIGNKLKRNNYTMEHFSTQNGNILGMETADVILDYYQRNSTELLDNTKEISKVMEDECCQRNVKYRKIGIMLSIKTAPGEAASILRELKQLGILVYLYITDKEEGISIIPSLNIDIMTFKKAISIILKKI